MVANRRLVVTGEVILCLVLLIACSAVAHPPGRPVSTIRAGTPPAPGGAVPRGFRAASVTFTSESEGWVLGTEPCRSGSCPSVLRTTDGGVHWIAVPAPGAPLNVDSRLGVDELRFADTEDGFAFGGSALWTTHDGGARWRDLPSVAGISPYVVGSLVATPNGVDALVSGYAGPPGLGEAGEDAQWRLVRASPSSGNFTIVTPLSGSPGSPYLGELATAGDAVYALDGDKILRALGRTVTTTALPPHQDCNGPVTASSAADLLLVCGEGVADGSMGEREIYGSIDSGRSWVPLPDPGPGAGYDTLGVADGGNGHAAIATYSAGDSGVLVTTDFSESWTLNLNIRSDDAEAFADLGYVGDVALVIYGPATNGGNPDGAAPGRGALYRSTDGGADWSQVHL
jgi:hypothetical protein